MFNDLLVSEEIAHKMVIKNLKIKSKQKIISNPKMQIIKCAIAQKQATQHKEDVDLQRHILC